MAHAGTVEDPIPRDLLFKKNGLVYITGGGGGSGGGSSAVDTNAFEIIHDKSEVDPNSKKVYVLVE